MLHCPRARRLRRSPTMPELPEVESARRLVARACLPGDRITEVLTLESGGGARTGLADDKVVPPHAELRAALLGRSIASTARHGKVQILTLSGAPKEPARHLLVHFGMTGAWGLRGVAGSKLKRYSVDTSSWPPRYTKLELVFASGARLALTDPRRLAKVTLAEGDARAAQALGGLGGGRFDLGDAATWGRSRRRA